MQTKHANQWRTCLVQVPGQLHGGLHLHVVLEEALPKRGLVVGLARLGLDGRLHAGLGHFKFKLNLISSWLTVRSLPGILATGSGPALTLSLSVTWTLRLSHLRLRLTWP